MHRITGTVLRDTISIGNWIIRIVPVIRISVGYNGYSSKA